MKMKMDEDEIIKNINNEYIIDSKYLKSIEKNSWDTWAPRSDDYDVSGYALDRHMNESMQDYLERSAEELLLKEESLVKFERELNKREKVVAKAEAALKESPDTKMAAAIKAKEQAAAEIAKIEVAKAQLAAERRKNAREQQKLEEAKAALETERAGMLAQVQKKNDATIASRAAEIESKYSAMARKLQQEHNKITESARATTEANKVEAQRLAALRHTLSDKEAELAARESAIAADEKIDKTRKGMTTAPKRPLSL